LDALAAHTGTHVDAPYHFVADGAGIETLDLDVLIGEGVRLSCSRWLSAATALAAQDAEAQRTHW
jgi:kynurenine formamidase